MTHLDILIHVLPLFFLIFVANIQVLPLAQTYLHPFFLLSFYEKHVFILIYKSNYLQEYEIIVFFFFFFLIIKILKKIKNKLFLEFFFLVIKINMFV